MTGLAAVTGAEGFIGSHLVDSLVRSGRPVRAMVQYNSFNSWGWLEALEPDVIEQVQVIAGDVRDARSVRELMQGAADVFHLAALIAIPYSYQAPASYVETNVLGTLNILEAARELQTPRILHTSTSEVYGTAISVPISETHPLQAQSPYAASKIAADKLVESYHLSFGLPTVTVRPFNTYGPRQSARAVIPTIISQLAAGQTEIRLGSLTPTRDFNFAEDTAAAFLSCSQAPAKSVTGRVFNAGSGSEISIGNLVSLVAEIMGKEVDVKQETQRQRPDASEVMRLLSDSQALHQATGWQPRVSLRTGLERTSEWFLDQVNLALYKTGSFTI